MKLSKLEEITDLRTVWPHEAADFTLWLAKEFRLRKPSMDHWLTFSAGSSACRIDVLQIQKRNELAVELYIPDDKDLYQTFLAN